MISDYLIKARLVTTAYVTIMRLFRIISRAYLGDACRGVHPPPPRIDLRLSYMHTNGFYKICCIICNVLSVVQVVLLPGHPLIKSFLNGAPPSKEDPESAAVSLSPYLLTDPIVFSS